MTIVHVILSLDPAYGGPPIVAANLAAAQCERGHGAILVAHATPTDLAAARLALQTVPGGPAVQLHPVPPASRFQQLLSLTTRRSLPSILQAADIVHIHGVWDPICRIAGDLAASLGIPYALTPHGMLDPWGLRQKRVKKQLAMRLGYRRFWNGAAFVHALNIDEQHGLNALGLTNPIHIVPNGIVPEQACGLPPAGSFVARYPQLHGKSVILFLSRLHPKKGLDYLADAFAQVCARRADAHLVVIGPDDGARAGFQWRIRELGLSDRVLLPGPIYGTEKLAAYGDASVFCLPSRQEGFSVAILEALACAVPVVVSTECHFPEVAAAGAGHIVDLHPAAIATALLQTLADEPARRRMGQAGRDLVLSRYTWPRIAVEMDAAYQRVLSGRRP